MIGILNQMGDQAQQQVWNGPSPRPDAGTALAAAGAQLSEAVAALFALPGMHNHITGTMKTEHVGCARVEQVGSSKVTNVGGNHSTCVGNDHGLSAGKNINIGAGQDWSLVAGDTIDMTATHNIQLHAGRGVGLKSDNAIFISAEDEMDQAAKKITISASDELILMVGENNILIKKDGTMVLWATKSVVIAAGEKVTLQAGTASINVGPGGVLSNPEIQTGGGPESKLAADVVKNVTELIVEKIPGSKKWIVKAAGSAASYVEQKLHLYEKGKAIVDKANSYPSVRRGGNR